MKPGQAEVDALREDLSGVCWWCGAIADSREHKFKASDLRRLGEKGGAKEDLYWSGNGTTRGRVIQGIKRSDAVRFGKILCQQCNNSRSQPFDLAYELFSDYIATNRPALWTSRRLQLNKVFGSSWEASAANVARYYVKSVGCLMADNGFRPPAIFGSFMNGQEALTDMSIRVIKSATLRRLDQEQIADGIDPGAGLVIGDGEAYLSRDGSAFVGYRVLLYVGYVGVEVWWEADAGPGEFFYLNRQPRIHAFP